MSLRSLLLGSFLICLALPCVGFTQPVSPPSSCPPDIITQPAFLSTVGGTTASFAVIANGTRPLAYQWRRSGTNLVNGGRIAGASSAQLTISNVGTNDAGGYNVVITNSFGSVTSFLASLIIYPIDTDHDGMPDDWEFSHGFDPNDYRDASEDADADGNANYIEYLAGTDPNDPASRFDPPELVIQLSGNTVTLSWPTPPGIGSVLEASSSLDAFWTVVGPPIVPIGTVVTVVEPVIGPSRYYRLRFENGLYSKNIVGYTNAAIPSGSSRLANPFIVQDNTIGSLIPFPPEDACVVKDNGEYACAFFGAWDYPEMLLLPREPFTFWNPLSTPLFLTFVGEFPLPAGPFISGNLDVLSGTTTTLTTWLSEFSQPLLYQWQFNGTNIFAATNTALVITNAQFANAGPYTIIVRNAQFPSVAATSEVAVLTVDAPASIISPPESQTVPAGTNAYFSVWAAGAQPLSFRWHFNGVELADGPGIRGAASPFLTISNVQSHDAGIYTAVVSNSLTTVTSTGAVLTVSARPPILTGWPADQFVDFGASVTLHIQALGSEPFQYQWLFNDSPISGATDASLILENVQPTTLGNYRARVENASGTVTSVPATLAWDVMTWGPGVRLVDRVGPFIVPCGRTLRILPGTAVKFSSGLTVRGALDIAGNPSEPVILTSRRDDSIGGDSNGDGNASFPSQSAWTGLSFDRPTSVGNLSGVQVKHAFQGVGAWDSGAQVTIRHGIFSNNASAVSASANLVITHCLLAHNREAFIVGDRGETIIRNCTIVSNRYACQIVGRAGLRIESSIFAFNETGLQRWPSVSVPILQRAIFFSPIGDAITLVGQHVFTNSGNFTSDPRFVNRATNNFELDVGSPAIDFARGQSLTTHDLLGRLPHDDLGVANRGSGYPVYSDLGAFERQENTVAPDLAITDIAPPNPYFVQPGGIFQCTFTVANVGALTLSSNTWQDIVYLSSDAYLSPDDPPVARVTNNFPVPVGGTYQINASATVPTNVTGLRYILVRIDALSSLREPSTLNNLLTAPELLAVAQPVLTLTNSATGLLRQGEWTYFQLSLPADRSVALRLDASMLSGTAGLYVRFGSPPTLTDYNFSAAIPNQPDQTLRIPNPVEGTYYVGIFGTFVPQTNSLFEVSAAATSLGSRAVTPNRVGNAGRATLRIDGDHFDNGINARLLGTNGITVDGEEFLQDSTTLFVTFDLAASSAEPASYDLLLVNTNLEQVISRNAVTVLAGGAPDFRASLTLPALTRPGRIVDFAVHYGNQGIVDLASPLLRIMGPDDARWQLRGSSNWIAGPDLWLLALSTDGPADVLRPGQSQTIAISLSSPSSTNAILIRLRSLGGVPGDGSAVPINWTNWYPLEVVPGLQGQFGLTWKDYIESLGRFAKFQGSVAFSASRNEFDLLSGVSTVMPLTQNAVVEPPPAEADCLNEPGTVFSWVGHWEPAIASGPDANVSSAKPSVVIIHGMNNSIMESWIFDMAQALQARHGSSRNILAVDWCKWAHGRILWLIPDPLPGARNAPKLAALLAPALFGPIPTGLGLSPGSTHLIGHSHGAHVAGLTAQYADPKVKRLTALDASEEFAHLMKNFLLRPAPNLGGTDWLAESAEFVDFYKSSILYGGESPWGHDNFLLVENGYQWGYSSREIEANHGYAPKWFTETITNGGGLLGLGYPWGPNSWVSAAAQIPSFHGVRFEFWKGLIRGSVPGGDVIECLSEGINPEYTAPWRYPGAWSGGYKDSESIKKIIYDLAAAIEFHVSNVGATSEGSGGAWQAGGSGTISYSIRNRADNQSISTVLRTAAVNGDNLAFLGPAGPGPIRTSIWLSEDEVLDPNRDFPVDDIWFNQDNPVPQPGEQRDYTIQITLPGIQTILSQWGDTALRSNYYLFVDAATTRTQPYPGELYHENNVGVVPIEIAGETLSANAGSYPNFIDTDGDGFFDVLLDGSRSAPSNVIDEYYWSIGVSGRFVLHRFPVGIHTVQLTVRDTDSGRSDTDQATIIIKPRQAPPDGSPGDSGVIQVGTALDPEDKFGPAGHGSERYTLPGQSMTYRIEAWNKPEASLPAADAELYDILNTNLFEVASLQFTRVGFLRWDLPLPGGQAIDTRIDMRPDANLAVEITGRFNPQSGRIDWLFHSIDPLTGQTPADPAAGFLPPFNPATGYELAWVEFSVTAKTNLNTGSQITNQAFGRFDHFGPFGAAPANGPWFNTIDATAPASFVHPLPPTVLTDDFSVSWSGSDQGAGVASYDIHVSTNGGPWGPWLTARTNTSAIFHGMNGATYGFFSVARDYVGHVEIEPSIADATTMVSVPALLRVGITRAPLPSGEGQQIIITYPATPGRNYTVEYRDDLTSNLPWNSVPGGPHNSGTVVQTNIGSQRFYRVQVFPAD